MNFHLEQLVRAEASQTGMVLLIDVIRRNAMNPEFQNLIQRRLQAGSANLPDIISIYAVDFQFDQFVGVWLKAGRTNLANVIGGDSMYFQLDQFVDTQIADAFRLDLIEPFSRTL